MSASNPNVNKVIYGSTVLIDLTSDTAIASKVLSGYTFHDASGALIYGTCPFDVDSSEADANISEVLSGKKFAKNGSIYTGEMPNIGSQVSYIFNKSTPIVISQGYHDGSGSVGIDSTEAAKIIPGNIKKDISILGVVGEYEGASTPTASVANVTPSLVSQVIVPGDLGNYDYISQVNVAAIPYTEVDNAAGGKTVTIGAV